MSVEERTPAHVRRRRRERQVKLRELGYESYPSYLRSRHWAAKKTEYRASHMPQDCMCGESEGVQLHHKTYERVGAELLTDLEPLCRPCHAAVHVLERRGDSLNPAELQSPERAAEYAVEQDGRKAVAEDEFTAADRERQAAFALLPIHEQVRLLVASAEAMGVAPHRYVASIESRLKSLDARLYIVAVQNRQTYGRVYDKPITRSDASGSPPR